MTLTHLPIEPSPNLQPALFSFLFPPSSPSPPSLSNIEIYLFTLHPSYSFLSFLYPQSLLPIPYVPTHPQSTPSLFLFKKGHQPIFWIPLSVPLWNEVSLTPGHSTMRSLFFLVTPYCWWVTLFQRVVTPLLLGPKSLPHWAFCFSASPNLLERHWLSVKVFAVTVSQCWNLRTSRLHWQQTIVWVLAKSFRSSTSAMLSFFTRQWIKKGKK